MKIQVFRLIKMMIGFMVGMLIAMLFKLPYFYTAGVIAILSLEPTRKSSIDLGIRRVVASFLGIGLAALLFYLFGYEIWVLFVLIAIFIPLAFLTKTEQGIVVSIVLISQIYLEADIKYSLNAIYILLIGVVVALLLNLYMPKDTKIKLEINDIDKMINNIIQNIATTTEVSFTEVDQKLQTTYKNIQIEMENVNLPQTAKRLKYVEMRTEQVNVLKRIQQILSSVSMINEKEIILNYLKEFDQMIGEDNYALPLEQKLQELFTYFRTSDLPENREKFEERAQLYFVLLEINQFLNLKLVYHQDDAQLLY